MERINWWALLGAFLVACAMVTILVLKGHVDALTSASIAVGAIVLAFMNVLRGKTPPPTLPPSEGGSS